MIALYALGGVIYFAVSMILAWSYPQAITFKPLMRLAVFMSASWAVGFMAMAVYTPDPSNRAVVLAGVILMAWQAATLVVFALSFTRVLAVRLPKAGSAEAAAAAAMIIERKAQEFRS